MFVKNNTLNEVKAYFVSRLKLLFSETELGLMFKWLAIKRFGISPADYLLSSQMRFSESDLLFFRDAVKRLQNHEPFQYILGEVEFYGLRLIVAPGVLIPRPETEELVDWILQSEQASDLTLMDICAGSGCIGMAIKAKRPRSNVVLVELSSEAIEIMQKNADLLQLNAEIRQRDVLSEEICATQEKESYDVWVSNPPYIPMSDRETMESNVLEHEPHVALFVEDNDPLQFYRVIGTRAQDCLKPKGWLYVEIHERFALEVKDVFEQLGFFNIEVRKDLQGKNRMIRAQKRNFTT